VLVTAGPASIAGISVACTLGTIDGEGLTTVLLLEGWVVIVVACCDGSTGGAGVATSLFIFGASCGRG